MIAYLGYGALLVAFILAIAATALALLSGPLHRPTWLPIAPGSSCFRLGR